MTDAADWDDRAFELAGPAVIARDFESELVIANLDTGLFYSCGGSAGVIWTLLEQGWPLGAVANSFTAPEQSGPSIEAFVASLQAEALIVPRPAGASPDRSATLVPLPFSLPTLERFDDLQGLLLVDPIHDVTERGWPLRANG